MQDGTVTVFADSLVNALASFSGEEMLVIEEKSQKDSKTKKLFITKTSDTKLIY